MEWDRQGGGVIIGLHIKSCTVVPVSFVEEEIWKRGLDWRYFFYLVIITLILKRKQLSFQTPKFTYRNSRN